MCVKCGKLVNCDFKDKPEKFNVQIEDEYCYVDVVGLGTISIKLEPEGIVVDVFPLHVVDEPITTMCLFNDDFFEGAE